MIGYAFHNGMLEIPKIKDDVEAGFYYTFLVGEKPKILEPTEELKSEYAYSLHFLVSKNR